MDFVWVLHGGAPYLHLLETWLRERVHAKNYVKLSGELRMDERGSKHDRDYQRGPFP